MDNTELWKNIVEDGIELEVSSIGRIRRKQRNLDVSPRNSKGQNTGNFRKCIPGGEIKQWIDNNGYMNVSYMVSGVRYKRRVHRLVAKAFVIGWFDGATVDHLDGNKINNAASNLEWVTLSENSKRQNRDGRGVPKGQKHPGAKLMDHQIPEIKNLRDKGLSYEKIGAAFGVSGSLIHKILTGKRRSL